VRAEELGGGSYLVTYEGPEGTLGILVAPGLLEAGPFSVRIAGAGTGTAGEYVLAVEAPSGTASARVVYDPTRVAAGCDGPARLDDGAAVGQLLDGFARSREGILLREASAFILEQLEISEGMLRDMSRAAACEYLGPPEGGPPNDLFSWTCLGAVFNQVAAGAAMVAGCGTPACGPAYGWCCASGVAWYTSAFIGTWTSCS